MSTPDRLDPNMAPGGLVVIAVDLLGREVTRSIVPASRVGRVDELASDAGYAVAERGGGGLVVYDGDSGELMWRGPMRAVGAKVRHHMNDLLPLAHSCVEMNQGYPWRVMGIFPTADTEEPQAWWNWFNYTVGLGPWELWMPCCSIEGRAAGNELLTPIINAIGSAVQLGVVQPFDSVVVPLGIPNEDDRDGIFWIGDTVIDEQNRYQCNMSPTVGVIPILWSSPLGWP